MKEHMFSLSSYQFLSHKKKQPGFGLLGASVKLIVSCLQLHWQLISSENIKNNFGSHSLIIVHTYVEQRIGSHAKSLSQYVCICFVLTPILLLMNPVSNKSVNQDPLIIPE